MLFARQDLVDDLLLWRGGRKPADRAIGDNFAFEENVSPARQSAFEAFTSDEAGLRNHTADHFNEIIRGAALDHVPDTFKPLNASALLRAIEPNQRVVRLICVERALASDPTIDFGRLSASSPPDPDIAARLIRLLNEYAGAPPAFACLRSAGCRCGCRRGRKFVHRSMGRLGSRARKAGLAGCRHRTTGESF